VHQKKTLWMQRCILRGGGGRVGRHGKTQEGRGPVWTTEGGLGLMQIVAQIHS